MSFSRAFLLATAIGGAFSSGSEAQTIPPPDEFRFETADHELIHRLARESRVDTAIPRPGVMAYLTHLSRRLAVWLLDLLRPLGRYAQGVGRALGGGVVAAALFTGVLLLFVLVRFLVRRSRSRPAAGPSSTAIAGPEPPIEPWDTERWRQELQRRIEASDVAGSLEAIWWWLARSVLGARVRDSWTSGELLSSSPRAGLKEPVRRLERMMYGGRTPSLEDVRELVQSLERQLA